MRQRRIRSLIRYLRDDLRLTSVKDGCSEGACGTCTVIVDGKATRACIPMVSKMEGKDSYGGRIKPAGKGRIWLCFCQGRGCTVRVLHPGNGHVRQRLCWM